MVALSPSSLSWALFSAGLITELVICVIAGFGLADLTGQSWARLRGRWRR